MADVFFKSEGGETRGSSMLFFPAEELLERVVETAQKIGNGVVAVSHAKEAIRTSLDMSEAEGFGHEALHFAALFSTADQKEGMRAFVEKRKAAFKGA